MPAMPKIEMYATGTCPYCQLAMHLLTRKGVEYTLIRIDKERGMRAEMEARSGRSTVPQVFIDARHVGGFDDLSALDEAGELDAMLGLGDGP
jgi:glutaredoxin 3